MTSLNQQQNDQTEKINHLIMAGMYFSLKEDYVMMKPDDSLARNGHPHTAKSGTVLMVQQVDHVDNAPHTVVMKSHPDWIPFLKDKNNSRWDFEIKFLIEDFARMFEFCENADEVRQIERQAAEKRIKDIQEEMRLLQEDPQEMKRRYLISQQEAGKTMPMVIMPGRISNNLQVALGSGDIAEFQQSVQAGAEMVKFAATTMSEVAEKLGDAVNAVTPYYTEKAALAVARIQDTLDNANTILEGVKTLDLWVGNEVDVIQIAKGESAAPEEKLHVYQRIILIAPEMAKYEDIDSHYSAYNFESFVKAIKDHPDLLRSIMPAQRGVLAFATRKDEVDYGDGYINANMRIQNKMRSLLVRDGENLYVVESPLWAHKMLPRLFPSKQEIDNIYKQNGDVITFKDLGYTKAMKNHAGVSMIYKRLMVLLGGLQARTEIFGKFCTTKEAIGFVSHDFQNRHMQFVHDDDGLGMMPAKTLKPIREYLSFVNTTTTQGSHVLFDPYDCVNPRNAPSAFVSYGRSFENLNYDQRKCPVRDTRYSDCLVTKREEKLLLKVMCEHVYSGNQAGVNVFMGRANNGVVGHKTDSVGWINLDAVLPEELRAYIDHRKTRDDYWAFYLRIFIEAERRLLAREQEERAAYDHWLSYATPLKEQDFRATLRAWRIAHPKTALVKEKSTQAMKEFMRMLDVARLHINSDTWKAEFEEAHGYRVIYATLSGDGVRTVYAEKADQEKNDVLHPDLTVWKMTDNQIKVAVRPEYSNAGDVVLFCDTERMEHYREVSRNVAFSENDKYFALALAEQSSGFDWLLNALYQITTQANGSKEVAKLACREFFKALIQKNISLNLSAFSNDTLVIPLAINMTTGWSSRSVLSIEYIGISINVKDDKHPLELISYSRVNSTSSTESEDGHLLPMIVRKDRMRHQLFVEDGEDCVMDDAYFRKIVSYAKENNKDQITLLCDLKKQTLLKRDTP